ncbi:hypothetical protein Bca52824_016107 [Brassica carinata]|uniref:Uncharacterized protein n=1 Tax=Brassica carinata TaxID=52824 RepID=A0A8X7W4H5_BRACI|nr:hypothetical protein Bca52824_016107 [Brassica carinata]
MPPAVAFILLEFSDLSLNEKDEQRLELLRFQPFVGGRRESCLLPAAPIPVWEPNSHRKISDKDLWRKTEVNPIFLEEVSYKSCRRSASPPLVLVQPAPGRLRISAAAPGRVPLAPGRPRDGSRWRQVIAPKEEFGVDEDAKDAYYKALCSSLSSPQDIPIPRRPVRSPNAPLTPSMVSPCYLATLRKFYQVPSEVVFRIPSGNEAQESRKVSSLAMKPFCRITHVVPDPRYHCSRASPLRAFDQSAERSGFTALAKSIDRELRVRDGP